MENFEDVTNTNNVLSSVSNDEWFWIGNTKNSKFTNWDNGEPDNRDGNEDCVAIFRAHDGRWHDRNCEDKIHAICAMPAPSSIIPTTIPPLPPTTNPPTIPPRPSKYND